MIQFICSLFFLCASYGFAAATNPSDYCQTKTFTNRAHSELKGGFFTGFGYAVYCGDDLKPNELSRSVKAFWPSNSKSSEIVAETNEKLKALGYHQAIDYSENLVSGNLDVRAGVFVKNSASLKKGESLCWIYNSRNLVCTSGAKVYKNLTEEHSSLAKILIDNGYIEVAPSIYRK